MSKILKGLNESRNYGRDSWDSNMPGYQGDYGGAENFGRKKRDWDENDAIDARLRQQYAQRQEYEKSGKFWLKLKDTQRHLPAGPFIGKQAATQAAHELFKQQPELKGNLLLTAYGPDENVEESKEADYGADYQDMVKRVGQLAKEGPRKTVWDPVKRVYKTVPINPPKKEEVADEVTSAKPWSARDIELGRGSHLKNDKLEPGDKFEYGYFNKPKGSGTVIELVGSVGKESVTAKLDDGRTVKMPYLGSKPKNGYYIRKIIDKNTNEDFEKNVQDYAKLEKFVEFAKNKLESASGSTLDLVAKKLSEYEAENFVNSNVEKNVYKTRGYGFTPIITQLYLDEREKRGIEDTSNKPNSANYVNTPFGSITGPEAYWDVEISKWGGANGREIANDLINAGYVENKKEFLYMISLVKTMPELRQEIENSGIKVGSLDEYIFYAKELKGQGLIGNQEYLNSPYNDEKLEKALAKQIKESKEQLDENLHKWFKEKWVRFGPDGKIRGDCARGDDSEGKPKCLPQSKAHALGKKGRASAAARKRREDPNPERSGKAINVNTKKKTDEEQLDEKCWDTHKQVGMKSKSGKMVPNCVPKESVAEEENKPKTAKALIYQTDMYGAKGYYGQCKEPGCDHKTKTYDRAVQAQNAIKKHHQEHFKNVEEGHQQCPECGGAMYEAEMMNEKKDACYYKVKSRYKVWPSAYASGALVKCRKKGASNWGTGGKKNEGIEEDTAYAGGMGQGGNAGQSYRKYKVKPSGIAQGISETEAVNRNDGDGWHWYDIKPAGQ